MKRRVLPAVALVLLVLFAVLYSQYYRELNAAYQRVSDGSNTLITEHGQIEYGLEGEGSPVLLIHGAGGGYDQGLLMGRTFLGDGYRFVSVSRFGYLGSPFVDDSTVEQQAMLYAGLLDHLNIDRVIILGVSAGGPSALQFAHDYPDRSAALILVSAVSMFMGDEIPVSTRVVNSIQKSDFAYWLVLKMFRTQFLEMIGISRETYSVLDPGDRGFVDQMLEYMHPMSPRRAGNIHEARIRPMSGEAMRALTVPAMVIHAKDDFLVPFEHALFYHKNIEHSQLLSFDHGGHGLASELKAISNHIDVFLGEKVSPAGTSSR